MGKKGDLSDFEHGMVVGARRAGIRISKTADLLGFSRTTTTRFTENGPKKMLSCQYGPKSLRNVSNTLLNLCHEEVRQF